MGRVLRYLLDGFDRSVIIGAPDFSANNRYADMVNIGNDMRYAMKKVSDGTEKNPDAKPLKRGNRRRKHK